MNDVVDDVITRALAGDLDALEAVREAVRGSISNKSRRKQIRNESLQRWCDKSLPPEIVDIRAKVRKLHPALANYARGPGSEGDSMAPGIRTSTRSRRRLLGRRPNGCGAPSSTAASMSKGT